MRASRTRANPGRRAHAESTGRDVAPGASAPPRGRLRAYRLRVAHRPACALRSGEGEPPPRRTTPGRRACAPGRHVRPGAPSSGHRTTPMSVAGHGAGPRPLPPPRRGSAPHPGAARPGYRPCVDFPDGERPVVGATPRAACPGGTRSAVRPARGRGGRKRRTGAEHVPPPSWTRRPRGGSAGRRAALDGCARHSSARACCARSVSPLYSPVSRTK